jgi:hypothetical protein
MPVSSNVGPTNQTLAGNDFNALSFVIAQQLAFRRTTMLVTVVNVTNSGGVSPIGTVDVQPLVQQVNGLNEVTPHGIIYGLPYIRIQGGANAVIIDPVVGDIGIICIADRDCTTALSTQQQSPPGSNRTSSPADGFYMMSVVTKAPTQYVQFTSSGITITSPNQVTVNAPEVNVNASQTTITSPTVEIDGSTYVDGNLGTSSGASGAFTTPTGQIITVSNGIITNIF